MSHHILLKCEGFEHGVANIPVMHVKLGELIGLADRREAGVEWTSLISVLTGETPTKGVAVHCKASALSPFPTSLLNQVPDDTPILAGLDAYGISRQSGAAMLNELVVPIGSRIGDLQLTTKMMLEQKIALETGVELLVLSMAGLDPSGVQRVLKHGWMNIAVCSMVCLFHESHLPFYRSLNLFQKIIEVGLRMN